jgi:signal transduction histidine kinase
MKEKKLYYFLKFMLSIVLFVSAVYFENAQQERLILLVILFAVFLCSGFVRCFLKSAQFSFYLTFYLDIALVFIMEQNSRLLINYFFHSFYIIVLLEAALSLNLKRGILIGAAAVLVSLIKYGYLIYYKFNMANISQMAFFLLVNVLILVIAGFAQHNREERQRKDILYKELLDTHRQLKQYTDEVNRLSVIEERNRIARDIHDTIGHNMTALIMQLQMAEHLYKEDTKRADDLLANAVMTAKNSLSGIRKVFETLRGEEAGNDSDDAIRLLVSEFSGKTGVVIHLTIKEGDSNPHLEKRYPAAGMTLYRIVQEALTNAVRHGKATEVSIIIEYLPKEIRFYIRDNGIGVEECKEGYGLRGIRERAEAFGGTVTIETGQGFSVRGVLYLEDKND